jgi:hypothetical protein
VALVTRARRPSPGMAAPRTRGGCLPLVCPSFALAPRRRPRACRRPQRGSGPVGPPTQRPRWPALERWQEHQTKIWCSRISEGVPQASDQAVARHRVWQRWPETATRLRPCGAGQAWTDARLRPAAWPLSWEDRDAQGQRGRAGTGGDGRGRAGDSYGSGGWGFESSRRATFPQVTRYVSADPRSS